VDERLFPKVKVLAQAQGLAELVVHQDLFLTGGMGSFGTPHERWAACNFRYPHFSPDAQTWHGRSCNSELPE
jgi:hypothetical protein